jgi:hypothetical protein
MTLYSVQLTAIIIIWKILTIKKYTLIGGLGIVFVLLFSLTVYISARDFSKQGSYVEVKGLSEKIVKSDTAIWSLSFEVKSNSVEAL